MYRILKWTKHFKIFWTKNSHVWNSEIVKIITEILNYKFWQGKKKKKWLGREGTRPWENVDFLLIYTPVNLKSSKSVTHGDFWLNISNTTQITEVFSNC